MNTAAAIRNDVLSDRCRDNGYLFLDAGLDLEGHTGTRDEEHVDFCPLEGLEDGHSGLEAEAGTNTRGSTISIGKAKHLEELTGKSDRGHAIEIELF